MIENVKNFIYTCESTLARYNSAKTDAERSAILSRETVRGIQFAIDFCNSLVDYVFDLSIRHIIFFCKLFVCCRSKQSISQNATISFVKNPLVNKVLQFRP